MATPGIATCPGALLELARHAAVSPNSVALIEPTGTKLTFAGLQDRIAAVAHRLNNAGIRRKDSVALVLPDGADLMAAFLGVASVAGCAILNPALRGSEIQSTLTDLEARAVIVDPSLDSPAEEIAQKHGILVLEVESGGESPAGDRLPERLSGDDVALLLHTSATTGKARIAPLTHSNLTAMAANTRRTLNLTSSDRFLSMMPLFHLQGLLSSLAQLLAGGSVVCSAGFDPATFLSWLEEYHPTW
ncbi:MAG TPA: AMP-binding protein, partial [Bryobacteraceae bacterium]